MSKKDKADVWMPVYIGAYLADTTNLNTEQHGAYLLLLMTAWRSEGMLPNDDEQLKNISKLSPAAWKRNRAVLLAFFSPLGDKLVQKRLMDEYEKAQALSQKNQENGKKGGRPKTKDKPDETQTKPSGFVSDNPNGNPNETQAQSPTPNPISEHAAAADNRAVDKNPPAENMLPLPPMAYAELLKTLESKRGYQNINWQGSKAYFQAWRVAGVSRQDVLDAHAIAVQRRDKAESKSAINPGLLDAILKDVLAMKTSSMAAAPKVDPRQAEREAIQAKWAGKTIVPAYESNLYFEISSNGGHVISVFAVKDEGVISVGSWPSGSKEGRDFWNDVEAGQMVEKTAAEA